MKRRSGIQIMGKLIGLIRPLMHVMAAAILLGVTGYLCAIFLTVLAGVEGIFAEDNYPKRKRIYQLGDAIADCRKSRLDGVGYYPGLLSADRYCLLDHP